MAIYILLGDILITQIHPSPMSKEFTEVILKDIEINTTCYRKLCGMVSYRTVEDVILDELVPMIIAALKAIKYELVISRLVYVDGMYIFRYHLSYRLFDFSNDYFNSVKDRRENHKVIEFIAENVRHSFQERKNGRRVLFVRLETSKIARDIDWDYVKKFVKEGFTRLRNARYYKLNQMEGVDGSYIYSIQFNKYA
jgi:hypothetical protein